MKVFSPKEEKQVRHGQGWGCRKYMCFGWGKQVQKAIFGGTGVNGVYRLIKRGAERGQTLQTRLNVTESRKGWINQEERRGKGIWPPGRSFNHPH